MSRSRISVRYLLTALALAAGLVLPASSAAAKPVSDAECIRYAGVVDAPKGKIPRDDLQSMGLDPVSRWAASHPEAARQAIASTGTTTVQVAFHVLRKNTAISGGNAPLAWIEDQIDVLNDSYSGATGGVDTGFRFELSSVDRTTKASWFKLFYAQGGEPRFFRGSHKEIQVKKALYEGGPQTLNVYTGALGKFLLGWSYYPSSFVGDGALPRFYDGVVIDYRSMPGADFGPYDEGDTLTHEVGHWLELLHTFAHGCEQPGDKIQDTAYEASPAFGCPVGRDTCPESGLDPIHNFMDYTDDSCMFKFTPDQAARMQMAWSMYRG
jgi:hypothetical protein